MTGAPLAMVVPARSTSSSAVRRGTSFDGTARLWDVASRQQSQLAAGGFASNTVAALRRNWRTFAGVGAELYQSNVVTLWPIS